MATDFAVQAFFLPVLIAIIILALMAWKLRITAPGKGIIGIGGKRLCRGYLGILVGTLIISYIETYFRGVEKVELGHIQQEELAGWISAWGLYIFTLITPFILIAVTFICLPLFWLFSKINFNSLAGAVAIGLIFPLGVSFSAFIIPFDPECESHVAFCSLESFIQTAWPAVLISVCFSIFAGLPLLWADPPEEAEV